MAKHGQRWKGMDLLTSEAAFIMEHDCQLSPGQMPRCGFEEPRSDIVAAANDQH